MTDDHKKPKSRTQTLATIDDGWFERLCAWADESDIQEKELPRNKAKLLAMQELWLSKARFTTLPPEIGQLGNLKRLYLIRNPLTDLPDSLKRLYLERNGTLEITLDNKLLDRVLAEILNL